ncbi:MAG: hypothetical protein LBK72_10270 [Bifidobacteriaceae bacterium]|nr:hypothetical protein [Bifidobacteriaceae bacterium]
MFSTTIARKSLVAVSSIALAATALVAVSPAAFADDPLVLGELQATPTSGQFDPIEHTGWITNLFTNEGQVCPAGFRTRAGLYAVASDGVVNMSAIGGVIRAGQSYDLGVSHGGINDGETSINRVGERVSITEHYIPWVSQGVFEIRHTCQAAAPYVEATDPYYSLTVEIEADGSWQVLSAQAPEPADTAEADITVVVPQAEQPPTPPEGLKLTAKPGNVTLTSADQRVEGQVWQAGGTLGTTTVDDDRQDATADDWSLTGKVSDFSDSGTNEIGAANLGWTPTKVSGAGTAGAAIAPNASGGLGASQTFATGEASDSAHVETSLTADLALDVPAATPAGTYAATLTLTLI